MQLNLYVPTDLEKLIKESAKKQKKTISAFVTELIRRQFSTGWKSDFFTKVAGKWKGDFPSIEALPFEEREKF